MSLDFGEIQWYFSLNFRGNDMKRMSLILALASVMLAGCVERQLTVNTVPTGSMVTLNDEEIGYAPVTTSFQWYGDYRVRVSKPGYETLATHRKIQRPWHDRFPLDFFASIWPGNIKDKYEWTFDLQPYTPPSRQELLEDAKKLQLEAGIDVNAPAAKAPAEPNKP